MHPEASWTQLIALETMAAELGMTPLEFFRKIAIPDDMHNQDNNQPMTTAGVRTCLEYAASQIGYEQKYHAPGARTLSDGRKHGIGITFNNDRHGTTSTGRGVVLYMNGDGTANFVTGQSNNQIGCNSVTFAAIIAETLGLTFDSVVCSSYGTADQAPNGGMQAGSTGATTNGAAAQMAALDVRAQMFEFVAGELEVNPEDLDASEGKIFVKSDATKFMTHADVMGEIDGPIIGVGKSYATDLRRPFQGEDVGTRAYHREGVAAAWEVAVDTETGEVEILDMVHVLDAGRVVDPFACDGQIKAAMWVSIAKAFIWDVKHDPQTGTYLHQTYVENKTPTHMDIAEPNGDMNKGTFLELLDNVGPFGMHGLGEPAASIGYPALLSAVNNALGGNMIMKRPCTFIDILKHEGKA